MANTNPQEFCDTGAIIIFLQTREHIGTEVKDQSNHELVVNLRYGPRL